MATARPCDECPAIVEAVRLDHALADLRNIRDWVGHEPSTATKARLTALIDRLEAG
jgi:hypothetical protein